MSTVSWSGRHQLIWAGDKNYRVDPSAPVPLILFPAHRASRAKFTARGAGAREPAMAHCMRNAAA